MLIFTRLRGTICAMNPIVLSVIPSIVLSRLGVWSILSRRTTMNDRLRFGTMLSLVLLLVLCPALSVKAKLLAKNVKVITSDSEGRALDHPTILFYDPYYRETYVTDESNGQLVIYGADFFPKVSIGTGRGMLPVYGGFVQKGVVYACIGNSKEDKAHILVLNKASLPIKKIYFSGFAGAEDFIPRKLVIARDGTMYVVGLYPAFVIVMSSEGDYLRTIVPKADMLGVLEDAKIVSLAIGGDGRLYFLSEALGKIFVYSEKEKPLYSFGEKGGVSGKLARPKGLALDEENGRLYIADYLRHSISVFSFQGKFLLEFGGKGTSRGWFQYPTDISVDHRGNVVIADTFNDRIQVFRVEQIVDDINIAESSVLRNIKEKKDLRQQITDSERSHEQQGEEKTQGKRVKEPTTENWVEGDGSTDF